MIDEKKLIEELNKNSIFKKITNAGGETVYSIIDRLPKVDVPDTNVGEWIPCSERLPENDECVLVSLDWESVDIGWYYSGRKEWHSEYCTYDPDYGVEAWMPLPPAFEGE